MVGAQGVAVDVVLTEAVIGEGKVNVAGDDGLMVCMWPYDVALFGRGPADIVRTFVGVCNGRGKEKKRKERPMANIGPKHVSRTGGNSSRRGAKREYVADR